MANPRWFHYFCHLCGMKNGNFHCKRISVAGRLDVVRHGLGDGVLSVEGVADIQGCVSAARLEADKVKHNDANIKRCNLAHLLCSSL